jgi:hypothetical protein
VPLLLRIIFIFGIYIYIRFESDIFHFIILVLFGEKRNKRKGQRSAMILLLLLFSIFDIYIYREEVMEALGFR